MLPNNDDAAKYGYEDPDAVNKYGYEDPDSTLNKYGYADPDAQAKNKYGYEDQGTAPGIVSRGTAGGFARRSSMKQEGAPRTRRRASIQTVGMIEVNLPGRSEPVLRRTSIDFIEMNVEVHPSPDDAEDPNEKSERWMSSDDYKKIEHDNHKIVRAIEKGTDKHFCTRGLENQLKKEADRIKEESRQAVWEEQMRQKKEGTYDEAKLMEKYRMSALQSKIDAVERAEQDNAEIEAYLKSTRKMMRRTSC